MSDTPRTDALTTWIPDPDGKDCPPVEVVVADFARVLEGELAWAKKLIQDQADALAPAPEAMAQEPAWIPWNGGDCPIMVEYKLRGGQTFTQPVTELDWEHGNEDPACDILAYRVTPMNSGPT